MPQVRTVSEAEATSTLVGRRQTTVTQWAGVWRAWCNDQAMHNALLWTGRLGVYICMCACANMSAYAAT